jgi:hypothetical protein
MGKVLKECPFCGNSVMLRWDGYYQAYVLRHDPSTPRCIMDGRIFAGYSVDQIVGLWNTRADKLTEDDRK